MSPACPRCRALLSGPFCASCGLRFDGAPPLPPLGQGQPYPPVGGQPTQAAPWLAPHPGVAPPGMPPGWAPPQGGPYMGPGGMPYVMMQAPPRGPSKRWAMVGGIMDLVACGFYVLVGLAGMAGASSERGDDKSAAIAGLMVFLLLGVLGIVFGIYAIKGRWGGALGAGILHSLMTVICFAGVAAVAEQKDRYADSYYQESARNEGLAAAQGGLVMLALFSLLTAIFCFIGISGAKNHARHQAHVRASDHF